MSVDGVRISSLPSKSAELAKYLSDALDATWNELRGVEICSVGIASISYDEESKKLINMRNQGAMLSDATIREGYVQGAVAEGLKAAGSNTAGAAQAFMGMGMGMWVGENESAKYWATVLNSLKNRGIEDIFIACTDNLTGFSTAIEAVFPKTEIQNCIIHQLRNSSKYVSYKDIKALMADLKAVYAAVDEAAALDALDTFSERWDKKYPKIAPSWRENWPNLSTYFKYPQEVRRLIYTTNAIEGFNRQLRKVTKAKSVFPTDDSLLKMLYLAMMDITKKWTGRRQDWSVIHAQLAVFFADRMPD